MRWLGLVCLLGIGCSRDALPAGGPDLTNPDLNPCPADERVGVSVSQPCNTPSTCCVYSSPPALLCDDTGHWAAVSNCAGDAPPDFAVWVPDLATRCGLATECNDMCVDTRFDDNNCGGCGVTCPQGAVCGNGMCVKLGPCAFQPNRGTCVSDLNCGGVPASCKLGKCCSAAETIDPVTCKCHCNGGPECADTSQFCCLQGKGWDPDEPDTLKCRDEMMCSPKNNGP